MHSHNNTPDTSLDAKITGFSLDKYLLRVGLTDYHAIEPDFETLATIIKSHLLAFNYQNTILFNQGKLPAQSRQVPSLNINKLFPLMLEMNGGYCYQHLELMYAVLSTIGFNVNRYLAKVIIHTYPLPEPPTNLDKPKTHELLIVTLNGKQYLVDIGMANQSIRKPLEIKEGEQLIDDDQYRLTKTDNLWTLDTKTTRDTHWFCIYQFFNNPVKREDIEASHTNLYLTDKELAIRDDKLLIGKTTLEKRKYLLWNTSSNFGIFKSIKKDSSDEPKTRKFTSLDEAREFAEKKFGIGNQR